MVELRGKTETTWAGSPCIARVTRNYRLPAPLRKTEALLIGTNGQGIPEGFRCILGVKGTLSPKFKTQHTPFLLLPEALNYLEEGDVVRINPQDGTIYVMHRRCSPHNTIFLTHSCNCNCVMCPQPPRRINDSHLVQDYLDAIPLMSRGTKLLGITGGEPTLLKQELLQIIRACKSFLPDTALQLLSNGRMFSYLSFCQAIANIKHPDMLIGIALYSAIPNEHNFIVQADGAFDQTVRGLMNLKRCGQKVEVRIVLHRLTVPWLPRLARFIGRNLPFVDHVALMGLEAVGYAKSNIDVLWIDPAEYVDTLREGVDELVRNHLNVSIYNHQLCTLHPELWPFARQSISDWKNEYVAQCEECVVRNECGGFFSSVKLRSSAYIKPVTAVSDRTA